MGKLYIAHSYVKPVKQHFGQSLSVDVTVHAGCALAGSKRTNLCTCSAEVEIPFCHEFFRFRNSFKGNAYNLCGKSGSEEHLSVSESFSAFRNGMKVVGRKKSCDGHDPARKTLGSSILEKAFPFNIGNLFFRDAHFFFLSGAFILYSLRLTILHFCATMTGGLKTTLSRWNYSTVLYGCQ